MGSVVAISNSILWNNSDITGINEESQIHNDVYVDLSIDHSCVHGWTGTWPGAGNTGVDPLFIDPDGLDNVVMGRYDERLELSHNSPLIDAGDSSKVPWDKFDLDGDVTRAYNRERATAPQSGHKQPRYLASANCRKNE